MNIQQFIHETLVQIATGVQNANDTFAEIGLPAQANPPGAEMESRGSTTYRSVSNVHTIKFDIAVEVCESTESNNDGKTGFDLKILSGSIGSDRTASSSQSTTQRLEFSVPLKLARPTNAG